MLSLIYFILILGLIVFVHELGHFIFAKFANVYIHEFSIGMGKKIFGKKAKNNETEFCIRAIPLGGYVMMAGEDMEDKKVPKDRQMCNKSFIQRFLILFAGPFNNFLFAIIILFISALIFGYVSMKPIIGDVALGYPAMEAGIEKGDIVLSINNEKITNWDKGLIKLQTNGNKEVLFEIKKSDGRVVKYRVMPKEETDEDGNKVYKFGIATSGKREHGFINSMGYAFRKTISLFGSMFDTLKYLFTGKVSVNQLAGPVGIYSIVDSQAKVGFEALLYLVAYLSINVGVINLLPFPAFDGGRILFLLIEKIFRKPVSGKVENTIHTIGFILIIGLLIYVTINDIIRLF